MTVDIELLRRLPKVSLHDHLGREFTLLVFNDADSGEFKTAADSLGIPLQLVKITDDDRLRILERKLLLVRPDQHVVWRGDKAPQDCAAILQHAVGWRIALRKVKPTMMVKNGI